MNERRWVAGERELAVVDGRLRTLALGGHAVAESCELALVLDASRSRHDVEGWRFARGRHDGFERQDFDDSSWRTVPHLHPIYDVCYAGYASFRTRFPLPAEERGERVTLVLGGLDDEDWTRYAVWVNGVRADEWEGAGRWREPRRIVVDAAALRFGDENLLAVETRDLDRRSADMPTGEDEHYFFQGWLLDQFVVTGEPYRVVDDFAVTVTRGGEVELAAEGLAARISYDGSRKRVTVRNEGGEPVRLLDVVLDDLRGDFRSPTKGGRGWPVLAGDLFLGVEHTAGLAAGENGRIRALVMPGAELEPGATFACPPVVAGRGGAAGFRGYLESLRPRRERRLTIYDTLGWTDYASELAERPRLNEALFEQSLERLDELRRRGVAFDLYALDDWWEPGDFAVFNRAQYPRGSRWLAGWLREVGMGVTLWSATTQAAWSSHDVAGLEASIAGGVARELGWLSATDELASWDWDAVFAHVSVGQMRYCWASEPFRSHLRDGLATHVADTGAEALKLDCTVLHCTSAAHDHFPGRHSVHAIHESVLDVVRAARERNPELFVIWYWGFQSPWWLASGDLLFDKALKLEAASPASHPAPSWRAGVTLNSDQALRHASLVPLSLQDSLGVWLGDVPWANWMGAAGWHDAFMLDLARGSTLVSFWGDLWLLDEEDEELLAAALALVRETEAGFREAVPVGGDPWRLEPYGYAQPLADGALLTVANPGFEPRVFPVELGALPGAPARPALWEIYPSPGCVDQLTLLPWEVRVLRVVDASVLAEAPARESTPSRATTRFPLRAGVGRSHRLPPEGRRRERLLGEGLLPDLDDAHALTVWARISRDGGWRYDPEPQSLFSLDLSVAGEPVAASPVPSIRSWNGPGCPWVTWTVQAEPARSREPFSASLAADLPAGYAAEAGVVVYDATAIRRARRISLRVQPRLTPQGRER